MELAQLRAFMMVSDYGSFTRVARELDISQPAVSAQISALERELEVRLFDRLPRRVMLTAAGKVLDHYVRMIFNMEMSARRAIAELQDTQQRILHLGASPTIGAYILPELLAEFYSAHKQTRVIAEVKPTFEIATAIEEHSYELGLVEAEVESDTIEMVPFMKDELVLVTGRRHPLATQDTISLEQLASQAFITREPGSGTRAWVEAKLKDLGVNITAAFELGEIEAIKGAATAGLGITIISKNAVLREVSAGDLVIIPVRDLNLTRSFYYIYPKYRNLTPTTLDFITYLSM